MTLLLGDLVQYKSYLDKGYMRLSHCEVAYHGPAPVTPQQHHTNDIMQPQRLGQEWSFNNVGMQSRYLDCRLGKKIQLQAVGKYYIVASLVSNVRICLYGSQQNVYWNILPPNLEDYINQQV